MVDLLLFLIHEKNEPEVTRLLDQFYSTDIVTEELEKERAEIAEKIKAMGEKDIYKLIK